MNGGLANARGTYLFVNCCFSGNRELNRGDDYLYQILKKRVTLLLGSITPTPPTVFMKPSSYLKVTAIMSLIITSASVCSFHDVCMHGASTARVLIPVRCFHVEPVWIKRGSVYFCGARPQGFMQCAHVNEFEHGYVCI